MRYYTKLAGVDREVVVRRVDGGLSAEIEGETRFVDVSAVSEGRKYSVLIDGRSFSVTVEGDGRRLSIILGGQSYLVDIEDERERAAAGIYGSASPGPEALQSVMPGIVRRVFVERGARVAAGDRLLILEAMKMENEIRAEVEAVVADVKVSEGDTVEGGQTLIEFAEPE